MAAPLSDRLATLGLLLLVPLLAGALWGGVHLALDLLFGQAPPDWPWHGYVWRAYGLGLLGMVAEGVMEGLAAGGRRRRERRARRIR